MELAEILRRYGPQYLEKFGAKMPYAHRLAMRAIERCRTPALGGHVYHCPDCDETHYHYHSCRNRHCPKCQNNKAQLWLEKQKALLLPTPYFLLTFTLPSTLRQLARSRPRLIYNLLFQASAAAVQQLARDPRFVGGQVGLVGVLHTWSRNLAYHPHVHYLAPGGGLAADGHSWRPARGNFFLPVKALSLLFRAKFRDALRQNDCFQQVPAAAWQQEWVVHCQPVGSGLGALKYLAPYIFRVALSNNRIVKLEQDRVTFRYRDGESGRDRLCTLAAEEFIRRFLQHVLPKHFVKVRYYGFFSPGLRPRLAALRQVLVEQAGEPIPRQDAANPAAGHPQAVRCPSCGRIMQRRSLPRARGGLPP